MSHLLTNQKVRNPSVPSVFTFDWDNFDQYINKLVENGIINTAHRNMLHELKSTIEASDANVDGRPQILRNLALSFNMHTNNNLPDCYVPVKKKGPAIATGQECYLRCQNIVDIFTLCDIKTYVQWKLSNIPRLVWLCLNHRKGTRLVSYFKLLSCNIAPGCRIQYNVRMIEVLHSGYKGSRPKICYFMLWPSCQHEGILINVAR